jgi:hypothetical protein
MVFFLRALLIIVGLLLVYLVRVIVKYLTKDYNYYVLISRAISIK